MTQYTCKARPLLRGQAFRDLRHRIKFHREESYSARDFAHDLKISESLLQLIETDRRAITPPVAAAYLRVEREFIYWMKDLERVDAQTTAWLVEALVRHAGGLTPHQKKTLVRLGRGVI